MFGIVANLKTMTIASAVVAVMGFGGGWTARDALCDAAEFKRANEVLVERVRLLERNIARIRITQQADAEKHSTDAAEIARLEEVINDTKLDDGGSACFSGADADRVRDLWK